MTRYLVAYFDTNGVGRLAGNLHEYETLLEAQARIAAIERAQTKAHKVDYRVIPFEHGSKLEAKIRHGIAT